MSLKSLLRIGEEYLRRHPTPTSVEILKDMLKLTYTYTAPATNSKSKRQVLYPLANISATTTLQTTTPLLNYDEKANRLQFVNNFDSISTQQAHEKVMQDAIFGSARFNRNKDKWIYAAKKKVPKSKSYFVGGSGKSLYTPDLGQLYDEVTEVQIFIWDLKLKKIFPIDIKIEGDETKYVFSYPIFANDEGTKFICHGYKRTQFGHGISFCFNRPVEIFEVSIQNLGQENSKTISKKLITKHETNMFANISPCYNYILYFGGSDYIHSYYLDLVILKRVPTQNQSQKMQEQNGYNKEWRQIHRIQDAFIGSYYTIRTQTYNVDDKPFAYFQTIDKAQQRIKEINLESGEIRVVSENKLGQSYGISCYNEGAGVVVGNLTTHAFNTFFYMKTGEGKIVTIPPLNRQEFIIEEINDPVHGYYLDSQNTDPEFKKDKKPLVVLVHGGPHAHGDACITMLKYMLLKCGYAVLLPNYSGSAGFGQQYMKAAVGNVGTKDAEEIIKLLENVLQKKPHLDRSKVYVYGGSYGGYMAAIMGTRYDKYFKAAVILNGVISIPGNYWFSDIPEWSAAETLGDAKIHNLTAEDYVKMYEQSPITKPMKIPTLQFLGAKDRRVPYRQGLLFDAMTKKAGTPIQTFVYQNAAHSLSDSVETSVDVVMKSMLFLQGIPIKEEKPADEKEKIIVVKQKQPQKLKPEDLKQELKQIQKQI